MTFGELKELMNARRDHRKDEIYLWQQILAWHAANIMNVHLKRKVTPDRLLKKRNKTEPRKLSHEQRIKELKEIAADFGRRWNNGDNR